MSKRAVPPSDDHPGVEIISTDRPHDGFFKVDVFKLRHRRFDGSWTESLEREVFHIPHAVSVLLYDPILDQVALIEQFRVGALDHPGGPWLIECVAGLIEPGEDPMVTAMREVTEETGLTAKRIEQIGTYAPSPGSVSEYTTMFIAEVDSGKAGGVHGLHHEGEDIRTHVVAPTTAFGWVDQGRISAVNALLSLRWLQLNRTDLRHRWQAST